MTGKKVVIGFVVLTVSLFFNACVVEYDFERAPPWTNAFGVVVPTRENLSGSARGWGGTVTVTLDLVSGNIENVRIEGRRETPSHTRELIQIAQRNAVIFNSFDFLDGMSGATITARAIMRAGEAALESAGVALD